MTEPLALTPDLSLLGWRHLREHGGRVDRPLKSMLDAGRPIIFAGRASGPKGQNAYRLSVDSMYEAVEAVRRHTGIDAAGVAPSRENMMEQLRLATAHRSRTTTGQEFTLRVATVDLSARYGVIFVVGAGTGMKLDVSLSQPWVSHVAQLVQRTNAALFAVKHLDRASRSDWGIAELMLAVQSAGTWLCTDAEPPGPLDDARSIVSFVNAVANRKVASELPEKARKGMVARTGTQMVSGQVSWHSSAPVPPGFAVSTVRSEVGGRTIHRVLFIDSDECRPAEDRAGIGLPKSFDANGRHIDNAALVQWFLSHYGRPGYTLARCTSELVARGFSTDGLRARYGDHVTLATHAKHPSSIVARILNYLDLYETGEFNRGLGYDLGLRVENCFPPSGAWAAPEDFARIRGILAARPDEPASVARLTFSGMVGELDGVRVRLGARAEGEGGAHRYVFLREDLYPDKLLRAGFGVWLEHRDFAESIVEGIATASDGVLEALAETVPEPGAELAELHAQRARLVARITSLEKQRDALIARLEQVDDDGNLLVHGHLLHDLQRRYESLVGEQLPEACHQLRELDEDIAAHDLPANVPAAEAGQLLHLVASLRDGSDLTHRALWLQAIKDLVFTSERVRDRGVAGRRLSWSGTLVIGGDDVGHYGIPFQGAASWGALELKPPRIQQLIDEMAAGTP